MSKKNLLLTKQTQVHADKDAWASHKMWHIKYTKCRQ